VAIRVVGFDGGDTLWRSESRFEVTQGEFRDLVVTTCQCDQYRA